MSKPLLDMIVEAIEERGFYRVKNLSIGKTTLWTHDNWKGWWRDPQNPDVPLRDREHLLLDVVADIIGEESGWEKIHYQPEKGNDGHSS
jgi:hypothetical protein